MRIETVPLVLGVLIAMLGIGIMFDAWTPDATLAAGERRRRPRVERHRNGEAMIGLGVLGLAAAFIGRDNWRYSILVVIVGALFLVVGAVLNGRYVREMFVNRGPLRRRDQPQHEELATGDASEIEQERLIAGAHLRVARLRRAPYRARAPRGTASTAARLRATGTANRGAGTRPRTTPWPLIHNP